MDKDWHWWHITSFHGQHLSLEVLEQIKKIELTKNTKCISWYEISLNKNITETFIRDNIHQDWNFRMLSMNPCISVNFVQDYFAKDWNWQEVSINKSITWTNMKNNQHFP
jgi:hypothetical protein